MPTRMRAHGIAVLAGLVLAVTGWACIYRLEWGLPTVQSRWAAQLYERKTAIMAATAPPRIVIVGGSSSLFSIRADLLSRELGRPAVNYATHAALGLRYLLHRAKQVLRRGDLLVLVLEYELYEGDPDAIDPYRLDYLLARDPDYLASMPLGGQVRAAWTLDRDRVLRPWKDRRWTPPPGTEEDDLYLRPRLDAHGDMLGSGPDRKSYYRHPGFDTLGPVGVSAGGPGLPDLQAFIQWCRDAGVHVVAVAPALMDSPWYHEPEHVRQWAPLVAWYREMRVPMLLEPLQVLYPADDLLDTRYHLHAVAAERHTRRLVPLLLKELAASPQ